MIYQTNAALNMGVSKQQIYTLLTANRRFTKTEAVSIIAGKKPVFKIKPQKIK